MAAVKMCSVLASHMHHVSHVMQCTCAILVIFLTKTVLAQTDK